MRRRDLLAFAVIFIASPAYAISESETSALGPGEFIWTPEAGSGGPVRVVVNLSEQLVHVYRGGARIGVSTTSTGRNGYRTPTGTFTILEKRVHHRSSKYNNAPMPYMQRLTWAGVAFHAGSIPGRRASHGCIRLPRIFARHFFEATDLGTVVVVRH